MSLDKAVRGRPRSEEVRRAVLDAFVAAAAEEGYERVSIDAVAKSAGVSRSTIYRWYKDKRELLLDASVDIVKGNAFELSDGDFQSLLSRFLKDTFATANHLGQLFTAMMAEAQADEIFAQEVWQRYAKPRRQLLLSILARHPEVYRLSEERIEFILDILFGAIWYRMMSHHAPLDEAFAQQLLITLDQLLRS
ncbi:TetR/AcrR family transcriptional regulator [Pseudoteredinibacter isoporae]|uniref:AcrR family transcriptional regulator n=1 Tax=Pseudoteredinibacter isoporae TaxID=570281 RepID=A0A7X0JWF5_9GAMM|nr:TetR/AcrR family transcriptional regulator [Pseudoteredinibacter isoporae]MBB6522671.1 AcrR family transcriptional regulator [Pseudoteredinibacter isoporae]NHO88202.1 TetR/AcrR family transcriptional regulator [Pseudoteredinibacter isoporae]NIB23467.1 TetR/AcrR family transcriptional regulator [Pseudoteredinibacter isoporae]